MKSTIEKFKIFMFIMLAFIILNPISTKAAQTVPDLVMEDIIFSGDDWVYGYDLNIITQIIKQKHPTITQNIYQVGLVTVREFSVSNDNEKNVFSVGGMSVGSTPTLLRLPKGEPKANSQLYVQVNATGLDVGTYEETLTLIDTNGNKCTSKVTLVIKPAKINGTFEITLPEEIEYGEEIKPDVTIDGVVTSYKIEYSSKDTYIGRAGDANEDDCWSMVAPTLPSEYIVRLTSTNPNYEETIVTKEFKIVPSTKELKIEAKSEEFQYDGASHENSKYMITFDGRDITETGKLFYDDVVSNVKVTGSITDVMENEEGNNKLNKDEIEITNKDYYANIKFVDGTLKIKPIETTKHVEVEGAEKVYDGTPLTNDNYILTSGLFDDSNKIIVTIIGTQTYVGESENKAEIKVEREGKDITANYSFSGHKFGILKVTTATQNVEIKEIMMQHNSTLTIDDLKELVSGEKGEITFEMKSTNVSSTFDEDGLKSSDVDETIQMLAKISAYDVNNDGNNEYEAIEKEFNVIVKQRENLLITGLNDGESFNYDGNAKTPNGTLKVQEDKVSTKDLDVKYVGTGDTEYNDTLAPTDAGTYKVIYSVKENNEKYMGSAEFGFSINKSKAKITFKNLSQKVGNVSEPEYKITPNRTNGKIEIKYKNVASGDEFYTETLPTEIGTYSVRLTLSDDKNLENAEKIETLKIVKKLVSNAAPGSATTNTTYSIEIKESENAEVTPNGTIKVEKGESKTFKIKAEKGYQIEDVLVDGKSVGAVSKYTFENIKEGHTLEVKTKKAEDMIIIPEETYEDVKSSEWYYEAVEYVSKKGLMNGVGNKKFEPNATTTRGMIVTILHRLEGEPEVSKTSFIDVANDSYYEKAIAWAEKNNIVKGYGNGNFGPDDKITREQFATIIYRYSIYKKYDTSVLEDTNILSYNDIFELAEYAFEAMQYACGESLINGMENGKLNPKGNATRAQVATTLMRYYEKYFK